MHSCIGAVARMQLIKILSQVILYNPNIWTLSIITVKTRAVVMAQLLERSLPTQRFTVLIQKSAKFK